MLQTIPTSNTGINSDVLGFAFRIFCPPEISVFFTLLCIVKTRPYHGNSGEVLKETHFSCSLPDSLKTHINSIPYFHHISSKKWFFSDLRNVQIFA